MAEQLKDAGEVHCSGIESTMKLRNMMHAAPDEVYVSGVGAVFSSGDGGKRPPHARF